ncbi:MAG TPA: acyl carrier protein [Thermoanaerobaculia bacterium]|nr:acyl carrier protein [Thermoanaerobaculia bacterium]
MDDRKAKIRAFLSRFFRQHELGDQEDIFALGFVNSLLAMQLVQFVEKEFGLTVEDADLDLDNFRSVQRIDELVARKLGVTGHVGA